MVVDTQFSLVTETVEEAARFQNLVLLCEASLKQESFRNHVDRVFENYVFSRDSKINMATKAILYNCMVCEDDFEYNFKDKVWVRTTSDRYAFNEAMRKFNKIIYHDRRFRGRIPWVVKNVKEYFKMKLVKKYYASTGTTPPPPATTTRPVNRTSGNTAKDANATNTMPAKHAKPVEKKPEAKPEQAENPDHDEKKTAEQNAQPSDSGDQGDVTKTAETRQANERSS